jgi:hypothetical protein
VTRLVVCLALEAWTVAMSQGSAAAEEVGGKGKDG